MSSTDLKRTWMKLGKQLENKVNFSKKGQILFPQNRNRKIKIKIEENNQCKIL